MKGIKMTYWLVVLLLAAAMLGGCGGSGSSGASNENDEHIKMVQEQKLNIGGKIYATKEVFEKFYGQGEWKKYGVAENIDIVSMEVPNKEGKSKIKLLWTVDTKKKEVDFFKLLARKGDHYSEEPVDWYHLLNNVIAKRLSDGKSEAKPSADKTAAKPAANPSAYSVGNLRVGMSKADVVAVLGGNPKAVSTFSNQEQYRYDNVDVIFKNNSVFCIETNGSKYATEKGVKEGFSLDDVIKVYGKNYEKSNYEQYVLYEYIKGEEILRFAIKQGRVDYISLRKK